MLGARELPVIVETDSTRHEAGTIEVAAPVVIELLGGGAD